MEINLPKRSQWAVERSHLVASHGKAIPEVLDTNCGLQGLERQVQLLADGQEKSERHPPIGPVQYRYESSGGKVEIIHCYFINKQEKLMRFMRLRRIG